MLKRYLLEPGETSLRRQAQGDRGDQDAGGRRASSEGALRAFFLASLGDLPERTPLNPQVVGTTQREMATGSRK